MVGVVNAGLAAVALRRHGPVAMTASGLLVATHPLAVASTHTVMLEPWVTAWCLGTAIVLFNRTGDVAGARRQQQTGVIVGAAMLTKLWAAPFAGAAALVTVVYAGGRAARRLVVAAVATFAIVMIPFVVFGGANVVDNLITIHARRDPDGPGAISTLQRLAALTGHYWSWVPGPAPAWTIPLVVAFVALVAITFVGARATLRPADLFALAAATLGVAAALMTPHLYPAYTYLPGAALALLAGTTVGLLAQTSRITTPRTTASGADRTDPPDPATSASRTPPLIVGVATVIIATVAVMNADAAVNETRSVLAAARPSPLLDDLMPPGSCVVGDNSSPTVLNNRLVEGHRNCDVEIDAFGLRLQLNNGRADSVDVGFDSPFAKRWRELLDQADFVTMSVPFSDYLPWPPQQQGWFNERFEQVRRQGEFVVYARRQ